MLNGGLLQWIVPGQPLATSTPTVEAASFTPNTDRRWLATTADVRAAIDNPDVGLVATLTHGGGGFYGAHSAFILYLRGFDDVALYAGSLMEWRQDPCNPMATVPQPRPAHRSCHDPQARLTRRTRARR